MNRNHQYRPTIGWLLVLFAALTAAALLTSEAGADPDGVAWTPAQLDGANAAALAVNDSGVVAGMVDINAFPAQQGAMWDSSDVLSLLPGGTGSEARAVDASGVLGGCIYNGFPSEAALWNADGTLAQRLGYPTGGTRSCIWGMNEAGRVVGQARVDGAFRAFLWEDGEWEILGSHGGYTVANAINESGEVVGSSQGATPTESYAVLWRGGTMIDLPSLDGGSKAFALGINDVGEIVGGSDTAAAPGVMHAVLWNGGEVVDLGTLSGSNAGAQAITESGMIAGWMQDASGVMHAFVWVDGVPTELTPLTGDTHAQAVDINEDGVVVGASQTASYEPHAVRWTPAGVDPTQMLANLRSDVEGVGPGTSLADKVEAAQAAYIAGDSVAACNILGAFIEQVQAQSGKHIDPSVAEHLIADATAIIEAIGR